MNREPGNFNTGNVSPEDAQIFSDFNMQNVLWFSLGEEEYGIKVDNVQTVLDEFVLTPVPNTPGFVLGVINLRGSIIPVVDLRRMFQMPQDGQVQPMIVVLEMVELESVKVGLVVDRVNEVIEIDFSALQPPPPSLSGLGSEYITGIHKMQTHVLIISNMLRIVQIAREMIGKFT